MHDAWRLLFSHWWRFFFSQEDHAWCFFYLFFSTKNSKKRHFRVKNDRKTIGITFLMSKMSKFSLFVFKKLIPFEWYTLNKNISSENIQLNNITNQYLYIWEKIMKFILSIYSKIEMSYLNSRNFLQIFFCFLWLTIDVEVSHCNVFIL